MMISIKKTGKTRPPTGPLHMVTASMLGPQTGVAKMYPALSDKTALEVEAYSLVCLVHGPKGETSVVINNSVLSESESSTVTGFVEKLNGQSEERDISILGFTLDRCVPLGKPINCAVTGTFKITLRLGSSDVEVKPMDILDVRHPTKLQQGRYSTENDHQIFPEIFVAKKLVQLIDFSALAIDDEKETAALVASSLYEPSVEAAQDQNVNHLADKLFKFVFPSVLRRDVTKVNKILSTFQRAAPYRVHLAALLRVHDMVREFLSSSHRRTMTAKGTGNKGVSIDVYLG